MACFPRLFHHRSKNKFTIETDENTDTIFNTKDNPVQIGRYVRREEKPVYTPLITPNVSEAQLQRLKQQPQLEVVAEIVAREEQQQQLAEHPLPTVGNGNDCGGSAGGSLPRQLKKFRSNKERLQQAAKEKELNGAGPVLPNGLVAGNVTDNAINVTRSNSKLKPVKERRPTALPTEAPSVDDAGDMAVPQKGANGRLESKLRVNVNGIIDEYGNRPTTTTTKTITTPTPTLATTPTPTTTPTNVKFFIGFTQQPNMQQHGDDDDDDDDHHNDDVVGFLSRRSSNSGSCIHEDNNNNSNNNKNDHKNHSKLPNGTLPQAQHGGLQVRHLLEPSAAFNKPLKSSSNVSLNYLTKCKPLDANSVADTSRTFSLQRSASTTPDIYIPTPPPMPTELVLVPSTPLKKKSAELLSNASSPLNASNSQDQIPTPKDNGDKRDKSSTTNVHRVEGGLIFARPNLPVQKDIEIEFNAKDEATRNLIHNAIERNDFLNNLMDKERQEMVINAMASASYDKDSYIINENEEGSEIYVSAEGYYDVIKAGQHVGKFGPATVFGELAILYNAPRQATVRAATDARVWKIARETFRAIMQISGSREREENLQFLRSAPFLQELEENLLNKVVDLLQRTFYETDSCIVREGELGNEFFIIRCGTVTIKKMDEHQVEQVVAKRKRGDYFGEQALMNADCRQASVYADAPGTEVLKLDREAFISYLGTIKQLREKPTELNDVQTRSSNKSTEFDNEYSQIAISELKKIATLGAGAFGRVDLVTHNNQVFALKIIKKIDVVKQDQIAHVYNEKNVMIKCRESPFIVQLYRTYRNEKYVYFLMEACMGGDVWTVMTKRQYFDEKTAKFIAGCVVEAFDYLHAHNFIYRDLKPENLMLTADGYCKLVDFGFAKYVRSNEKTNTFAGTPEYVAPEIILDRGHDRSVDYWALGILIFELLVGTTPFRGDNQVKIYQLILSGLDIIHMPSRIPKSAQHLIKHLCKQLPAERLGYQRRGIADIKRHSWFDNLDWEKLRKKQLQAPIKRILKSKTDVQYFKCSGVEKDYEPPEELSGWDMDF